MLSYMNVIMIWAWMLWLAYVLVTGRYYGLGMDVMKDMPGHATLVFLGGKPMWIQRTATLARIFDCTPKIFDDSVFTLASLGAMVQVRLPKQAFKN